LAYDGARWHARAWCFNRSVFNDFVLARMLGTGEQRASSVDPALDGEWNEYFALQIAPHPGLSPAQRQGVEMDYGMEKGVLDIRMRLALTQYFERHYGLDLPDSSLPPQRRQIVLKNRDALIALRNCFRSTKEPE
jgi:predicted DNA-binding transcriptional regulator YafY